jgi:hypothetical protein
MIEINYFSGDCLLTGMSKKHNNLKLCCLSQGAVEVICFIAFMSELRSIRVFRSLRVFVLCRGIVSQVL